MRSLLIACVVLCALAAASAAEEIVVAPPGSGVPGAVTNLDSLFAGVADGTVVRFSDGVYELTPKPYVEPTCGNCPAESTQVEATVGLTVTGRGIWILGPSQGEAVLRTNAGYGVLFENCTSCSMEGMTVTAGARDTMATATDAAVVVKRSSVGITNCTLRDNVGDPETVRKTVVGIMGVAGREGAVLTVRGCRITGNSWDGVALYRGAQGVIEDNLIDGVDLARGETIGGGRGVGIGLTWNAFATVRGNLVRHYWKGIGVFVDAQATVEENVVEHVATWGLTLWDAEVGRPAGTFRRNVVYDVGACGASVVRTSPDMPPPGQFVQNVLVKTGQDPRYDTGEPYCFQTAIAEHAVPETFSISANIPFQNREPNRVRPPGDLAPRDFEARMKPVWAALGRWEAVQRSDFWADYREFTAPVGP